MNTFFHGTRFYILAATGVLLLVATLALMVWMQMFAPYQLQERIVAEFKGRTYPEKERLKIQIKCMTLFEDPPWWYERLSGWMALPSCEDQLDTLSVTGEPLARLNESDLSLLARLPFVKQIFFHHVLFPERGPDEYLRRSHAHSINFLWTNLNDAMVDKMPELPKVRYLEIRGSDLSDHGLSELIGRCPKLKSLKLSEVKFGIKTKQTISGQIRLTRLRLDDVSDADLEILGKIKSLEILELSRTAITDADLEHLKGLSSLDVLVLDETKITDAGLEHLKELPSLCYLSLYKTDITDVGFDLLNSFPSLKNVKLDGTKTTRKWTKKP